MLFIYNCSYYKHKRYYASVPLFLISVDGVVNDFMKSKGLFAEETDVTAWDIGALHK